ncbi:MAG: uncharacterized protein KVP18_001992 [Porospora cf. gigantea A]|uniref:uncharacterized protein n=1 Tax=Porospora cf. gigantea A TaxID=2853593 RepID=UPI0035594CAB|nr:MAG: hypothetical protein KVP18_001992 [Porospora cf. gigantea A]
MPIEAPRVDQQRLGLPNLTKVERQIVQQLSECDGKELMRHLRGFKLWTWDIGFQTHLYFWAPLLNRFDGILNCYAKKKGLLVDLDAPIEQIPDEYRIPPTPVTPRLGCVLCQAGCQCQDDDILVVLRVLSLILENVLGQSGVQWIHPVMCILSSENMLLVYEALRVLSFTALSFGRPSDLMETKMYQEMQMRLHALSQPPLGCLTSSEDGHLEGSTFSFYSAPAGVDLLRQVPSHLRRLEFVFNSASGSLPVLEIPFTELMCKTVLSDAAFTTPEDHRRILKKTREVVSRYSLPECVQLEIQLTVTTLAIRSSRKLRRLMSDVRLMAIYMMILSNTEQMNSFLTSSYPSIPEEAIFFLGRHDQLAISTLRIILDIWTSFAVERLQPQLTIQSLGVNEPNGLISSIIFFYLRLPDTADLVNQEDWQAEGPDYCRHVSVCDKILPIIRDQISTPLTPVSRRDGLDHVPMLEDDLDVDAYFNRSRGPAPCELTRLHGDLLDRLAHLFYAVHAHLANMGTSFLMRNRHIVSVFVQLLRVTHLAYAKAVLGAMRSLQGSSPIVVSCGLRDVLAARESFELYRMSRSRRPETLTADEIRDESALLCPGAPQPVGMSTETYERACQFWLRQEEHEAAFSIVVISMDTPILSRHPASVRFQSCHGYHGELMKRVFQHPPMYGLTVYGNNINLLTDLCSEDPTVVTTLADLGILPALVDNAEVQNILCDEVFPQVAPCVQSLYVYQGAFEYLASTDHKLFRLLVEGCTHVECMRLERMTELAMHIGQSADSIVRQLPAMQPIFQQCLNDQLTRFKDLVQTVPSWQPKGLQTTFNEVESLLSWNTEPRLATVGSFQLVMDPPHLYIVDRFAHFCRMMSTCSSDLTVGAYSVMVLQVLGALPMDSGAYATVFPPCVCHSLNGHPAGQLVKKFLVKQAATANSTVMVPFFSHMQFALKRCMDLLSEIDSFPTELQYAWLPSEFDPSTNLTKEAYDRLVRLRTELVGHYSSLDTCFFVVLAFKDFHGSSKLRMMDTLKEPLKLLVELLPGILFRLSGQAHNCRTDQPSLLAAATKASCHDPPAMRARKWSTHLESYSNPHDSVAVPHNALSHKSYYWSTLAEWCFSWPNLSLEPTLKFAVPGKVRYLHQSDEMSDLSSFENPSVGTSGTVVKETMRIVCSTLRTFISRATWTTMGVHGEIERSWPAFFSNALTIARVCASSLKRIPLVPGPYDAFKAAPSVISPLQMARYVTDSMDILYRVVVDERNKLLLPFGAFVGAGGARLLLSAVNYCLQVHMAMCIAAVRYEAIAATASQQPSWVRSSAERRPFLDAAAPLLSDGCPAKKQESRYKEVVGPQPEQYLTVEDLIDGACVDCSAEWRESLTEMVQWAIAVPVCEVPGAYDIASKSLRGSLFFLEQITNYQKTVLQPQAAVELAAVFPPAEEVKATIVEVVSVLCNDLSKYFLVSPPPLQPKPSMATIAKNVILQRIPHMFLACLLRVGHNAVLLSRNSYSVEGVALPANDTFTEDVTLVLSVPGGVNDSASRFDAQKVQQSITFLSEHLLSLYSDTMFLHPCHVEVIHNGLTEATEGMTPVEHDAARLVKVLKTLATIVAKMEKAVLVLPPPVARASRPYTEWLTSEIQEVCRHFRLPGVGHVEEVYVGPSVHPVFSDDMFLRTEEPCLASDCPTKALQVPHSLFDLQSVYQANVVHRTLHSVIQSLLIAQRQENDVSWSSVARLLCDILHVFTATHKTMDAELGLQRKGYISLGRVVPTPPTPAGYFTVPAGLVAPMHALLPSLPFHYLMENVSMVKKVQSVLSQGTEDSNWSRSPTVYETVPPGGLRVASTPPSWLTLLWLALCQSIAYLETSDWIESLTSEDPLKAPKSPWKSKLVDSALDTIHHFPGGDSACITAAMVTVVPLLTSTQLALQFLRYQPAGLSSSFGGGVGLLLRLPRTASCDFTQLVDFVQDYFASNVAQSCQLTESTVVYKLGGTSKDCALTKVLPALPDEADSSRSSLQSSQSLKLENILELLSDNGIRLGPYQVDVLQVALNIDTSDMTAKLAPLEERKRRLTETPAGKRIRKQMDKSSRINLAIWSVLTTLCDYTGLYLNLQAALRLSPPPLSIHPDALFYSCACQWLPTKSKLCLQFPFSLDAEALFRRMRRLVQNHPKLSAFFTKSPAINNDALKDAGGLLGTVEAALEESSDSSMPCVVRSSNARVPSDDAESRSLPSPLVRCLRRALTVLINANNPELCDRLLFTGEDPCAPLLANPVLSDVLGEAPIPAGSKAADPHRPAVKTIIAVSNVLAEIASHSRPTGLRMLHDLLPDLQSLVASRNTAEPWRYVTSVFAYCAILNGLLNVIPSDTSDEPSERIPYPLCEALRQSLSKIVISLDAYREDSAVLTNGLIKSLSSLCLPESCKLRAKETTCQVEEVDILAGLSDLNENGDVTSVLSEMESMTVGSESEDFGDDDEDDEDVDVWEEDSGDSENGDAFSSSDSEDTPMRPPPLPHEANDDELRSRDPFSILHLLIGRGNVLNMVERTEPEDEFESEMIVEPQIRDSDDESELQSDTQLEGLAGTVDWANPVVSFSNGVQSGSEEEGEPEAGEPEAGDSDFEVPAVDDAGEATWVHLQAAARAEDAATNDLSFDCEEIRPLAFMLGLSCLQLLEVSGVDPTVMAELPADVRNEAFTVSLNDISLGRIREMQCLNLSNHETAVNFAAEMEGQGRESIDEATQTELGAEEGTQTAENTAGEALANNGSLPETEGEATEDDEAEIPAWLGSPFRIEDIRRAFFYSVPEIVRQELRRVDPADAGVDMIDESNATFIASLDPVTRIEVLGSASSAFLRTLPQEIQDEAANIQTNNIHELDRTVRAPQVVLNYEDHAPLVELLAPTAHLRQAGGGRECFSQFASHLISVLDMTSPRHHRSYHPPPERTLQMFQRFPTGLDMDRFSTTAIRHRPFRDQLLGELAQETGNAPLPIPEHWRRQTSEALNPPLSTETTVALCRFLLIRRQVSRKEMHLVLSSLVMSHPAGRSAVLHLLLLAAGRRSDTSAKVASVDFPSEFILTSLDDPRSHSALSTINSSSPVVRRGIVATISVYRALEHLRSLIQVSSEASRFFCQSSPVPFEMESEQDSVHINEMKRKKSRMEERRPRAHINRLLDLLTSPLILSSPHHVLQLVESIKSLVLSKANKDVTSRAFDEPNDEEAVEEVEEEEEGAEEFPNSQPDSSRASKSPDESQIPLEESILCAIEPSSGVHIVQFLTGVSEAGLSARSVALLHGSSGGTLVKILARIITEMLGHPAHQEWVLMELRLAAVRLSEMARRLLLSLKNPNGAIARSREIDQYSQLFSRFVTSLATICSPLKSPAEPLAMYVSILDQPMQEIWLALDALFESFEGDLEPTASAAGDSVSDGSSANSEDIRSLSDDSDVPPDLPTDLGSPHRGVDADGWLRRPSVNAVCLLQALNVLNVLLVGSQVCLAADSDLKEVTPLDLVDNRDLLGPNKGIELFEKRLKDASGESSTNHMNERHRRIAQFCMKRKDIINSKIKFGSVHSPSCALSLLRIVPLCVSFDNKVAYFRSRVKQLKSRSTDTLRLTVRRESVFTDSYYQVHNNADLLRGRLVVHFQGEEGVDGGGLTKEWYSILSKEIFNPDYALFTRLGDKAEFNSPNPASGVNVQDMEFFRFVGRVIAKCAYDGHHMDAYFTRSIYKSIVGRDLKQEDLEAVEPDFYRNLQMIRGHKLADIGLELSFSVERNDFGDVKTEELIPGGANIPVTDVRYWGNYHTGNKGGVHTPILRV